jgi:hypothetical protein
LCSSLTSHPAYCGTPFPKRRRKIVLRLSFGMTGNKRHPTIFPVISMRLQDDQFCAECFAEERSHSYEGVSPIGNRFTERIFIFFSLGTSGGEKVKPSPAGSGGRHSIKSL